TQDDQHNHERRGFLWRRGSIKIFILMTFASTPRGSGLEDRRRGRWAGLNAASNIRRPRGRMKDDRLGRSPRRAGDLKNLVAPLAADALPLKFVAEPVSRPALGTRHFDGH